MTVQDAGVVAGTVSTLLFVVSYLPMLVKAVRTRDLASYSPGNLAVANLGNLVHTVYVVSLPFGPIWALHGFYLVSTALMMIWWFRFRPRPPRAAGGAAQLPTTRRDPSEAGGPTVTADFTPRG